jgi:hypothetical protein
VLFPLGVAWGKWAGLYIGLSVMGLSMAAQTFWLWYRSRAVMKDVRQRDAAWLQVSKVEPLTAD